MYYKQASKRHVLRIPPHPVRRPRSYDWFDAVLSLSSIICKSLLITIHTTFEILNWKHSLPLHFLALFTLDKLAPWTTFMYHHIQTISGMKWVNKLTFVTCHNFDNIFATVIFDSFSLGFKIKCRTFNVKTTTLVVC